MTTEIGDQNEAATAAAASPWDRLAQNIAPRRRGDRSVWELLWLGFKAHPWGILAGLFATYTALPLAIFGAVFGALAGAGAAGIAITQQMNGIASPYAVGVTNGLGPFAVVTAAGAGALAGFLLVYGGSWVDAPGHVLASLIGGGIITIGIAALIILRERWWLRLYGYRRLSWEEKARVLPQLTAAAAAMAIDLSSVPQIMIADDRQPNACAWAHPRTIVLTTGCLELHSDQEIAGVLVHELAHWDAGDAVGNHLVWASTWPLAITYNILLWLSRNHRNFAFIFALIAWPIWITVRLFVVPVQGVRQREHEYTADAATLSAGAYFREGLKSLLATHIAFEKGRTGWEEAITAAHPPTALRIERLISPDEAARRRDMLAHSSIPHWWR